jgi:hypothetical protein
MFSTLSVLNLAKSILVKEESELNINDISSEELVSNIPRDNEVNFGQLLNILDIFFT